VALSRGHCRAGQFRITFDDVEVHKSARKHGVAEDDIKENEPGTPTSGEVLITDDLIDRLAAEAEEGYEVAALRRRGGRRPLGSAPADVVPVRLDPELKAALACRAEHDHTSASEVIRRALRAWLDVA
jgi:hypothetical protein